MTKHFHLKAFQPYPPFAISGSVSLSGGQIEVVYLLSPVEGVILPQSVKEPKRRNELWRSSCFELFLRVPAHPRYLEFNCAPSGDWAIYGFKDYRLHDPEWPEPEIELNFSSECDADFYRLCLRLDGDGIRSFWPELNKGPWLLSPTVILDHGQAEGLSYWAIAHPEVRPNFHALHSHELVLDSKGSF